MEIDFEKKSIVNKDNQKQFIIKEASPNNLEANEIDPSIYLAKLRSNELSSINEAINYYSTNPSLVDYEVFDELCNHLSTKNVLSTIIPIIGDHLLADPSIISNMLFTGVLPHILGFFDIQYENFPFFEKPDFAELAIRFAAKLFRIEHESQQEIFELILDPICFILETFQKTEIDDQIKLRFVVSFMSAILDFFFVIFSKETLLTKEKTLEVINLMHSIIMPLNPDDSHDIMRSFSSLFKYILNQIDEDTFNYYVLGNIFNILHEFYQIQDRAVLIDYLVALVNFSANNKNIIAQYVIDDGFINEIKEISMKYNDEEFTSRIVAVYVNLAQSGSIEIIEYLVQSHIHEFLVNQFLENTKYIIKARALLGICYLSDTLSGTELLQNYPEIIDTLVDMISIPDMRAVEAVFAFIGQCISECEIKSKDEALEFINYLNENDFIEQMNSLKGQEGLPDSYDVVDAEINLILNKKEENSIVDSMPLQATTEEFYNSDGEVEVVDTNIPVDLQIEINDNNEEEDGYN
ncbi:hypothetical protein TVAG_335400 [Trichomonas vaginalis G3]|uniref:Uncharacterized protein n=1 Tax=Trichomonas vaginalis (strain ATCC PRA-98 / G3) TaxID=412133 RepID=A2FC67_TRIV3|nr:armadillo (ARM) repeat-containing protein family [Trichomonas vaginalis G3]EAX97480.1 hypothetical protein TVAG_335400 [Trichomonas vaginalis G3]KAI5547049.1 armadillo (ARM) repeat-containing protein family [Trichomonas vaginalis G3]|eukprot:XP_001310410.1 hypothetical protein [Trichomonas vaginalis G3]